MWAFVRRVQLVLTGGRRAQEQRAAAAKLSPLYCRHCCITRFSFRSSIDGEAAVVLLLLLLLLLVFLFFLAVFLLFALHGALLAVAVTILWLRGESKARKRYRQHCDGEYEIPFHVSLLWVCIERLQLQSPHGQNRMKRKLFPESFSEQKEVENQMPR
jgi:hypothetical protein